MTVHIIILLNNKLVYNIQSDSGPYCFKESNAPSEFALPSLTRVQIYSDEKRILRPSKNHLPGSTVEYTNSFIKPLTDSSKKKLQKHKNIILGLTYSKFPSIDNYLGIQHHRI